MVFSCISKYVNLLFCWNIYTPLFITSFDTSTGGIRKLATGGIVVWTIKEELFTRFPHLNWPVENSISCSFISAYFLFQAFSYICILSTYLQIKYPRISLYGHLCKVVHLFVWVCGPTPVDGSFEWVVLMPSCARFEYTWMSLFRFIS